MYRLLDSKHPEKITWESFKQNLSYSRGEIRSLRWFILLWVSIVSLWGSVKLLLGNEIRFPFGRFIVIMGQMNLPDHLERRLLFQQSPGQLPSLFEQTTVPFPLSGIAVLLMAVQAGLHWLPLSGRLPQRWFWGYSLLQGLCVLLISFIWSDVIIISGFYLVLIIEALSILKQVRQIAVTVIAYLILFVVTITWQLTHTMIWTTLESVVPLMVFLIGWIILSAQQMHTHRQLEAAHCQLVASAMRLEELTLLNERQRLARELHDILAQDLVGLTLQLERVDLHLEKKRPERARELVQQAMARTRATLTEARRAIDDLRASTLGSHNLLPAIQREISRFQDTTSIRCVADLSALALVPDHLCEHVLRVITEGLTNIARHSQARHVWICTSCNEAHLVIEVRDDGIGFESTIGATRTGHYGLLGLGERTRLCGGQLDVESTVGKGTTLRLRLPLKPKGGPA